MKTRLLIALLTVLSACRATPEPRFSDNPAAWAADENVSDAFVRENALCRQPQSGSEAFACRVWYLPPMPQSPNPAVLLFQRADNAPDGQGFTVALQNTPQDYVYGSAIQTTRSTDGWTCFNALPTADTLCSDTQMLDYLNAP